MLRLFNVDPMQSAANDNLNSDELRTLLEDHGDLIPSQSREMLSSILGMEELTVEDIMTPHAEIIGIDISQSIEAAQTIIGSSYYSRLPVFKGSIDHVIGMLHLKDSHQFIEMLEAGNDVQGILFDTTFISQSTTISTQLSQFQKKDNNLSLVVDEYGEIQGLLTMEDIFTEIYMTLCCFLYHLNHRKMLLLYVLVLLLYTNPILRIKHRYDHLIPLAGLYIPLTNIYIFHLKIINLHLSQVLLKSCNS